MHSNRTRCFRRTDRKSTKLAERGITGRTCVRPRLSHGATDLVFSRFEASAERFPAADTTRHALLQQGPAIRVGPWSWLAAMSILGVFFGFAFDSFFPRMLQSNLTP